MIFTSRFQIVKIDRYQMQGHQDVRMVEHPEIFIKIPLQIKYFRDLFGYSCSPQNIARFLTHFECLSTQQSKGTCTRFLEGIYLPGKDEVLLYIFLKITIRRKLLLPRKAKPWSTSETYSNLVASKCLRSVKNVIQLSFLRRLSLVVERWPSNRLMWTYF